MASAPPQTRHLTPFAALRATSGTFVRKSSRNPSPIGSDQSRDGRHRLRLVAPTQRGLGSFRRFGEPAVGPASPTRRSGAWVRFADSGSRFSGLHRRPGAAGLGFVSQIRGAGSRGRFAVSPGRYAQRICASSCQRIGARTPSEESIAAPARPDPPRSSRPRDRLSSRSAGCHAYGHIRVAPGRLLGPRAVRGRSGRLRGCGRRTSCGDARPSRRCRRPLGS